MLALFKQLINYIEILQQYNFLSESEANAMSAMVYVHFQLGNIKQQQDYIPEAEFKLLVDTIKSLPHNNPILPQMLLSLVSLVDVIFERTSGDRFYLEQLKQVIHDYPCEAFVSHRFELTSPSVRFLIAEGTLSEDNLARTLSLAELNHQIEAFLYELILKKHPTEVHKVKTILAPHVNSLVNAIFDKKLKKENYFLPLFLIAKEYCRDRIDDTILIKFIETTLSSKEHTTVWDPQEFASAFLLAFRQAYYELDDYRNGENAQNKLLHGFLVLLSTLDKHLPPGMLVEIFKNHVEQKNTVDPRNAKADPYATYLNTISFILGYKTTLDDGDQLQQLYQILQDPQKMYSLLDIIGHNQVGKIPYVTETQLHAISTELQHFLGDPHRGLAQEFIKLLKHYNRINDKANVHQQRNVTLLFIKFSDITQQLIKLMGDVAIQDMQRLVANTVLPLEQMLEIIPVLDESLITPLNHYFKHHVKNPKDIETFKTCLIAIGSLSKINLELPQQQFITNMAHDRSPQEFLNEMVKFLLQKILPGMDIELSETSVHDLFQRVTPEKLINLIVASEKMEKDQYRNVFLELLKRDLFGGDNLAFMHDIHQESLVGCDLARHNKNIRNILLMHGVIPESALEYDRTHNFILLPPGEIEQNLSQSNQYLVLWSYLQELKNQASKLLATRVQKAADQINIHLDKIIKCITDLENKINKQTKQGTSEEKVIADVLSAQENTPQLLKKIHLNCQHLMKLNPPLSDSFFEFTGHVIEQSELISTLARETSKKSTVSQIHYFKVEQWSKDKTMTFFLGDEVGCCLATTNSQFQAMVQRRMDDAMLFHVAIDQSTSRPAALIWLYLAKTTDDQIVLMANFFEVKAKFGLNEYLRLALFHSLLQFTQEYLNDNPAISGFYMNKLNYGWNEHDLESYPIKPLSLSDKVGGPYIPGGINEEAGQDAEETQTQKRDLTQDKYYLVSLKASQFHEFSPQVLAKTMHEKVIPIAELIHNYVKLCVKKPITFDQLLLQTMTQYRVQLEYFYNKPLQTNSQFLDDLYRDYESSVISHQTDGKITTSIDMLKTEHAFFSRLIADAGPKELEDEDIPVKKTDSNDSSL